MCAIRKLKKNEEDIPFVPTLKRLHHSEDNHGKQTFQYADTLNDVDSTILSSTFLDEFEMYLGCKLQFNTYQHLSTNKYYKNA